MRRRGPPGTPLHPARCISDQFLAARPAARPCASGAIAARTRAATAAAVGALLARDAVRRARDAVRLGGTPGGRTDCIPVRRTHCAQCVGSGHGAGGWCCGGLRDACANRHSKDGGGQKQRLVHGTLFPFASWFTRALRTR